MIARLALAFATLVACSPQPRSAADFEAQPDAAKQVVADCKAGAHHGPECANAQAGLAAARRKARMDAYRKGF